MGEVGESTCGPVRSETSTSVFVGVAGASCSVILVIAATSFAVGTCCRPAPDASGSAVESKDDTRTGRTAELGKRSDL